MRLMSIVTASVVLGATTGLSSTRASAQDCAAGGVAIPICDYTYAPFGDCTATGSLAESNPWRFSSEYADDELGCVYYNYRHYEPTMGRWLNRDLYNDLAPLLDIMISLDSNRKKYVRFDLEHHLQEYNNYLFVDNNFLKYCDIFGLLASSGDIDWGKGNSSKGNCWRYACNDPKEWWKFWEKHYRNPPGWGGHSSSCADMCKAVAKKKGVSQVSADGKCKPCSYKVLLVAGDNFRVLRYDKNGFLHIDIVSDYHWYRQDDDGSWSHKPGSTEVVKHVNDPEYDAKNRKYTKICCYLCFQDGGINAD